jgi:hypothetical protein
MRGYPANDESNAIESPNDADWTKGAVADIRFGVG